MTSVAAFDLGLSTLNRLRQKPRDALLHFAGGLVGEGDGENIGRRHAPGNQMSDAERDDTRLAGAGPGQDQQRAVQRFDGLALLGIE